MRSNAGQDRQRPSVQDDRHTIVIVKDLPVLQCGNCTEYLIEDNVMRRVDQILAAVAGAAELEVIRYAA